MNINYWTLQANTLSNICEGMTITLFIVTIIFAFIASEASAEDKPKWYRAAWIAFFYAFVLFTALAFIPSSESLLALESL